MQAQYGCINKPTDLLKARYIGKAVRKDFDIRRNRTYINKYRYR